MRLFLVILLASSTQFVLASGSSGGSGGGSAASGGKHLKISDEMLKKIKSEQEKKIEVIQATKKVIPNSFDHTHSIFSDILSKSVKVLRNGQATQINYKAVERSQLKRYLNEVSKLNRLDYNRMSRDQKLALLINTYNAYTIDLILQNYPLKSIKELGSLFKSPWKKKFIPFLGESVSLDQIEHEMIRKDPLFQEPRIHFAVNCASVGCPALLPEAFVDTKLAVQLDLATRNFLMDRERNKIANNKVIVSKIFDWYSEDFEKSWQNISSLKDFFKLYSASLSDTPEQEKVLHERQYEIVFSDYDWNLNEVQ